jgi:hypothetical protein
MLPSLSWLDIPHVLPSAEIAAECFWENVLILKRIFEFAGFGNEKSSPLKSKA